MAFVDACWFTAGSSGTADFADGTALSAFRSMAGAGAVDGEVYSYRAESIDRTQWEMGYGAYSSSGNTLARTVTASSAGGTTKVDFSAAPIVSLQPLARDFGNLVPFTAASSSGPASMKFAEDTDNGSNKVTVIAPASLASDVTLTLPSKTGTVALESDPDRRNQLLIAANTSKSLAALQRFLDMVAIGFKASGDADATSTGGAVDTSGNGAWKPTASTSTETSATPASGPAQAGYTLVDRSWSLDNSSRVIKIGAYSSSAQSMKMKIVRRDSATDYDVIVDASFSHPGGGWADLTLSSRYDVPASGTYYAAVYLSANAHYNSSRPRAFFFGDATGANVSVTEEASSNTPGLRAVYDTGATNAVLITPYQTADAARTKVRGIFEIDNVDSGTLGTDWTVEYTCNGGTNWAAASTYTNCGKGQSGRTIVETDEVTCTSGASFSARVKNLNSKRIDVYKAALKISA